MYVCKNECTCEGRETKFAVLRNFTVLRQSSCYDWSIIFGLAYDHMYECEGWKLCSNQSGTWLGWRLLLSRDRSVIIASSSSIHPINPSKGRAVHAWKKSRNSWNPVHYIITRALCQFTVHIGRYWIDLLIDCLKMLFKLHTYIASSCKKVLQGT
jgi:hypothetical protein